MAIPDELVQQFRAVAQERLERIESAWTAVLATFHDASAVQMHREVHTLKGESKMLGFSDVNLVCHKLEDLLEVARARGYAVDEDFDLAVNMAIRFTAMLVRKKIGAQLGGIDLPGFIRQIDSLLAELGPPKETKTTTGQMPAIRPVAPRMPVPAALRKRLATIAVETFIEYANARGPRRDRLRGCWHALRDLSSIHRAVIGTGQLAKHKLGAQALARELGKRIDVAMEIASVEATVEILSAVDMAVLHLMRNAVDHGIEPRADRVAAGKPENGRIVVRCGSADGQLVMTVEDDGRGVSMDAVQARAIELGLITAGETDLRDRWFDIVCQPGFTTRTEASDISGRGVGMDAVRMGVHDVGGKMTATTAAGRGTTWRIDIPLPKITFDAHIVRAPGLSFPIIVDATWQPSEGPATVGRIDLAHRLGLSEARAQAQVCYFRRGDDTFGIVAERPSQPASARRLVEVPAPAFAEVAFVDGTEGLLVHPQRVR